MHMMMVFVFQDGTNASETLSTAVATGSTVLAGNTEGSWAGTNSGGLDLVAVELNANGTVKWNWQVGRELDSPGNP